MKKVFATLAVALFALNAAPAAVGPIDTTHASANLVEESYWEPICDSLSKIDTSGHLYQTDAAQDIIVLKTIKAAAIGDTIYPWVELTVDLDSAKPLNTTTAIRITYMADSAWYLVLPDSTLDPDNSAPYQALMPAATAWTTKYFNVLDTSRAYSITATFTQPSWVARTSRGNLNTQNVINLSFSPKDDDDLGITTTIKIKDVTLFNYNGFPLAVKNFHSVNGAAQYSIVFTKNNSLKFNVPSSNNYKVSFYNAEGKRMAMSEQSFSANGNNEINLAQFKFAPGVYMVSISNGASKATGKFLIK